MRVLPAALVRSNEKQLLSSCLKKGSLLMLQGLCSLDQSWMAVGVPSALCAMPSSALVSSLSPS